MTFRDLLLRGRALLNPQRAERELDDELAFHVECETRKLVDQGLAPIDARSQALARFGSRTATADDCRDENAHRPLPHARTLGGRCKMHE